jgi:hypothetical protein
MRAEREMRVDDFGVAMVVTLMGDAVLIGAPDMC